MTDLHQDIVDIAVANPQLSTLVAAVTAADLVSTLKTTGPFTVFAPTNEAFSKIPAATLEALLKDKEQLAKVLTYHVVSGKVMAKDVQTGDALTVAGQNIRLNKSHDGVTVNDSHVVIADIEASNGVIHVIDSVLLPVAQ